MIYTIAGISDIREVQTKKYGKKTVYKVVLKDDTGNEFPVSLWRVATAGEKVDCELGTKNEYDEYQCTEKNPPKQTTSAIPVKTDTASTENQDRIARESVVRGISELLANHKDATAGEFFQIVLQSINVVFDKPLILFSSPEQRKTIVAKMGEDVARDIAFQKYGKPYLHLLTYAEANEIIQNV